jgi:predicted permease
MLLAVAGLFTRSLARADSVDPGFDAGRTAYVSLNLAMSGYDDARARRFYLNLSEALARDAGVEGAALTARVPLDLYGSQSVDASADGTSSLAVQTGAIAPGYFDVMGIRVVRGRSFTGRDAEAGAPAVAVVSAAAARRFWGGRDPIGRELRLGPRRATVVGVAADVKVQALGESPVPFVYEPIVEGHARLLRLVFRTGAPAVAVGRVRQLVRAEDPAVAVFDAGTMAEHVETMMYPYRAAAALGSVLGAIAIVLAGIGLYGVLACGVAERLRELAIRLALGAPSTALVRSALVESVRATAIGLVAGVGLALLAGRLLANVLFGISPADPVTLAAVAGVLAAVVAAASAGPVRRAIRVDPMQILRM